MDKKAKRILFHYFWSNGWIKDKDRYISKEDFNYATEKGLMFEEPGEPVVHDDIIRCLKDLFHSISAEAVTAAFVSSLSTKEVHLRSALSSYSLAKTMVAHPFIRSADNPIYCKVCKKQGFSVTETEDSCKRSVMNFERIKWGGVRHGQPFYAMFDLQQFMEEDECRPKAADIRILNNIFRTIDSCLPADAPRQLEERLKDVLPSSKSERDCLIEILYGAGILVPLRVRPVRGRGTDFGPVEDWRGEDGYNRAAAMCFQKYLD